MKPYAIEYRHKDKVHAFEIEADSITDAMERVKAAAHHGEPFEIISKQPMLTNVIPHSQ